VTRKAPNQRFTVTRVVQLFVKKAELSNCQPATW
jgi:hypothetical protein